MLQALLCSPGGEELQESWEIRIWGRGQKENIFPKDLIILLSSSNQVLLLLAFLEELSHPFAPKSVTHSVQRASLGSQKPQIPLLALSQSHNPVNAPFPLPLSRLICRMGGSGLCQILASSC